MLEQKSVLPDSIKIECLWAWPRIFSESTSY